ncbi:MAG: hypothetical protein GWO02_08460 [Gammaproteobacteria bacterium]|nr:hypothetical protein [Gammaproteobacteria bacterium]
MPVPIQTGTDALQLARRFATVGRLPLQLDETVVPVVVLDPVASAAGISPVGAYGGAELVVGPGEQPGVMVASLANGDVALLVDRMEARWRDTAGATAAPEIVTWWVAEARVPYPFVGTARPKDPTRPVAGEVRLSTAIGDTTPFATAVWIHELLDRVPVAYGPTIEPIVLVPGTSFAVAAQSPLAAGQQGEFRVFFEWREVPAALIV